VATTFVDGTNIASVWKWVTNGSTSGITYPAWAVYTPTQTDGGKAYAISKGYDFLTTINKGEGFWVNAKQPHTVRIPTGNAILATDFQPSGDLALKSGWNLISVGRITSPQDFNVAQGSDVTTIWEWNSMRKNWYFYSPSLETLGGPDALGFYLTSYITTKGYLDFSKDNRRFEPGVGFWVNRP
jgi:hypothetical protein